MGEMDYGSLMYLGVAARQNRPARAIRVMGELVQKHGYVSSGESISVADANEVWIFLEMIGKGPEESGAVWVARRVPDGMVCAHANSPRIRQFPLDDPENCLYSADVIEFARKKGFFSGTGSRFQLCRHLCAGRFWRVALL
jgi:dipeptidase